MSNSGWGLDSVTSSTADEIQKMVEREVGLDLGLERVPSLDDVEEAATEEVRPALEGGGRNGLEGQAVAPPTKALEGVYQAGGAAVWTAYGGQEAVSAYVTSAQVAVVATASPMRGSWGSCGQALQAGVGVARLARAKLPQSEKMLIADSLKKKTEDLSGGSEESADSDAAMEKASCEVAPVVSVRMEEADSDAAADGDPEAMVESHLEGKVVADADLEAMGASYEDSPFGLGSEGDSSASNPAETSHRTAPVGAGDWVSIPVRGQVPRGAQHGAIYVGKLTSTVTGV